MNWFDVYEFSSLRCCVSQNTGKEQEFWGGGQWGILDKILYECKPEKRREDRHKTRKTCDWTI